MPTSTTTFRFSDNDRRALDDLAERLVCSRTDVLRYAVAVLSRDEVTLDEIRGENLARAFLQSLRTQYGENAVIELIDGDPGGEPHWRVAGDAVDAGVFPARRQLGDRWVIDLIEKVQLHVPESWIDAHGRRHAVVPLRRLWVHASAGASGESQTRELIDGRTVVRFVEDDGTVRYVAVDDQGNSAALSDSDIPVAAFGKARPPASVGIGVRRESHFGPHVGPGVGGSYQLTGDLDADRAAVLEALEHVVDEIRSGRFDPLLKINTST